MKLQRRKSTVSALVLLVAGVLVLGWLSQLKSEQTLQFHGVSYFSAEPIDAGGIAQEITGPIKVNEIHHAAEPNSLEIAFEFSTQDATFSYGNVFQTGDSMDAVRMELQPKNKLVVVFGNGQLYQLSDTIEIGKFYGVRLSYERKGSLRVSLDGKQVLNISNQGLLNRKVDISKILVGTGLAGQRTLSGTVRNFNLDSTYTYPNRLAILAKWLYVLLCAFMFMKSLPSGVRGGETNSGGFLSNSAAFVEMMARFGVVLAFVAIALYSIRFFGQQYFGYAKWVAHLMLPISLVFISQFFKQGMSLSKWARWSLATIFAAYAIYTTRHNRHAFDALSWGLILTSSLAFYQYLEKANLVASRPSRGKINMKSGVSPAISVLFLVLAWSSLTELTNWQMYLKPVEDGFALVVIGGFFVLRGVFFVLFTSSLRVSEISQEIGWHRKFPSGYLGPSLDLVFMVILFWASFRHDSLFIPGSEYHWEYFVGVVQGIRNGGWLLWDTPSQYGFLNMLLASQVPSPSAWQSFFIFQGCLLFLVSAGIYLAASRRFSTSMLHRTGTFAIVFMALFFADPELIGPSPFPSSSVVRFFCVYVLVLVVCFVPKFSLRQAIVMSIVWALGVIWSAESAIYVTAIFLFVLAAMTQTRTNGNHPWSLAGKYVLIASTSLTLLMIAIVTYYIVRLGVAPDINGLFEHAVGYAGGFGYVPFSLSGPGNLLLLVFVGVSILCIATIQHGGEADEEMVAPLAAMAGCMWGISTYYIGRPVPQNVTAMLPLIAMVAYSTLMISRRLRYGVYSLPIAATSIPLIFLVLMPLSSQKWIGNLAHVHSFSSDIADKLPKASEELQLLLSRATPLADTDIVYYGDDAAPPILTGEYAKLNETNWLPIPLQLLEQPVTEARRSLYLKRYICRNQPGEGIIVLRKGDAIALRLQGFLRELSQFYDVEEVGSGNLYAVYRVAGIKLQKCPPVVGRKTS